MIWAVCFVLGTWNLWIIYTLVVLSLLSYGSRLRSDWISIIRWLLSLLRLSGLNDLIADPLQLIWQAIGLSLAHSILFGKLGITWYLRVFVPTLMISSSGLKFCSQMNSLVLPRCADWSYFGLGTAFVYSSSILAV